MIIESQMTFVW